MHIDLKHLDLRGNGWTRDRLDAVHVLRSKGASFSEIGEILHVTRSAIAGLCRRHGIPGPSHTAVVEHERRIAFLQKRLFDNFDLDLSKYDLSGEGMTPKRVAAAQVLLSKGARPARIARALDVPASEINYLARRGKIAEITKTVTASPPPLPPPPPVSAPEPRRPLFTRPIEIVSGPVHFLDRKALQCVMPLWGKDTPFFKKYVCGEAVMPGQSYCPSCCERAFDRTTFVRQQKKTDPAEQAANRVKFR